MGIECPKCYTENTADSQFCKKCATPLPSPEEISVSHTETLETPKEELTTGSTFAGRYQIIEELGKGGMGKVYKVLDTKIKEKVALKLLKPEIASDKKTIERFSNELKFARKIVHKNVGRMYDINEEKGTHYIAMEYVPGEDLKSFIRRSGQLTVGKAITIAKQICEGLAEAHRLGVVHRDLKPQNIMIDKEGNARIMDFGIARSLKAEGITDAGVMIGTPEYMSPEQVEGKEANQRSDIYSLGVILYEMVTGRVPFEGDTSLTIAMKHKSEIPINPKEINAQIPEDLSHMILRCMEKDKEKRHQGAKEVFSELERIEKGIPTTEKALLERKRFRTFIVPGILLFVAIVIVAGYFFFRQIKQLGKPGIETISELEWKNSIAVLPFADLSPRKDQEYFCDGMTEEIIGKLSKLGELKVISRTSVMQYKNTNKHIKAIGQELGVATILEGSIRKEKNNIRVSAQLINVEDGFHLWSDTYNRELESVFEVQDEVSESIAVALKVKFAPDALKVLKTSQPKNIEAYEYYLKGMHFLKSKYEVSGKEEDLKTALRMFEKAIEIDQKYALAYYGLAWAYMDHFNITQSKKELDLSLKNCEMVYKLDPNLAEANAAMGTVHLVRVELDKAYQKYKRALEIKPNSSIINQEAGGFFRNIGLYTQALEYYMRAIELDPFNLSHIELAMSFMNIGEFEKAALYLEKALEIEQDNLLALENYAELFIVMKKYDKAEEILTKIEKINPGYSGIAYYKAFLFAAKGEKDKALALHKNGVVYSLLGMKDESIKLIQDATKEGYTAYAYSYLFLKTSPYFDNLRDDPRFQEIVKKQEKKYEEYLKKYGDL